MKTTIKNYKKAKQLVNKYVYLKTRLAKCENEEQKLIIQKMYDREEKNKSIISTKDFCRKLLKKRLYEIAKHIPIMGYSMGSVYCVKLGSLEVRYDDTENYAKSCKYKATHGYLKLELTKEELINIKIIGGVITYIYPNQKSKIKKCWWYDANGKKNNYKLTKVEGYLYDNFHADDKEAIKKHIELCKETEKRIKEQKRTEKQKQRAYKKALQLEYNFADSINAGNCENGTKAFIMRCKLNIGQSYTGKYLMKIARERGENIITYIERMIKFKAQNI
jgi:hypothetical protein